MVDYRIHTFLKLCETMNYRLAAQQLNMTQPAVTQHIHFLENEYGCKLFSYNRKTLTKTKQAKMLEQYARSAIYNGKEIKNLLSEPTKQSFRIGATKTIGAYVINDAIKSLLKDGVCSEFIMDNTDYLLELISENKLDFALIEGFFDKNDYGFKLLKKEPFVGVCSNDNPLANKIIPLEKTFEQTLITRERGSGTRAIFEQLLTAKNFSFENFKKHISVSEFPIITSLVAENAGVTFAYEDVVKQNSGLSVFHIKGENIIREYNCVFLKSSYAREKAEYFLSFIKDFT